MIEKSNEISKINLLKDKNVKLDNSINIKLDIEDDYENFVKIVKSIPVPIFWKDTNFNYLGVNYKFEELMGIDEKKIVGEKLDLFINEKIRLMFEKTDKDILNQKKYMNDLVIDFVGVDGEKKYIRINKMPIYKGKEIFGILGIVEDMTNVTKLKEKMENSIYSDELTGLNNNVYFNEKIKTLNTSSDLPISVIMLDIDGLKVINDSLGHKMGDKLICKVSECMNKSCRDTDVVARLGGDEFAIILPKASEENCKKVIDRIENNIKKSNLDGLPIYISCGFKTKNKLEEDLMKLLEKADSEMYTKKVALKEYKRSELVKSMLNILFEVLPNEKYHVNKVAEISYKMAKKLKLDKKTCEKIKMEAYLHDIGKIGIDRELLEKVNYIEDLDWKDLVRHSEIGYSILNTSAKFRDYANIIYYHHEHVDGTGYPRKIKGDKIPFESKILCVADQIADQMHKKMLKKYGSDLDICNIDDDEVHTDIVDFLNENKNKMFDPNLADVAIKLLEKSEIGVCYHMMDIQL